LHFSGSHGDGDPDCTETPLVAWGAGVRGPSEAHPDNDMDDGFKFVDEHTHHMQTPPEWGLQSVERIDVNQADIAPLMVPPRLCFYITANPI
jgi:phosphatidylinositol glycan class N